MQNPPSTVVVVGVGVVVVVGVGVVVVAAKKNSFRFKNLLRSCQKNQFILGLCPIL